MAQGDHARLRELFPEIFRDGELCGMGRLPPGPRSRGGRPLGFESWPSDRRSAWVCGFESGIAQRGRR